MNIFVILNEICFFSEKLPLSTQDYTLIDYTSELFSASTQDLKQLNYTAELFSASAQIDYIAELFSASTQQFNNTTEFFQKSSKRANF